jgi:hypothetical protein
MRTVEDPRRNVPDHAQTRHPALARPRRQRLCLHRPARGQCCSTSLPDRRESDQRPATAGEGRTGRTREPGGVQEGVRRRDRERQDRPAQHRFAHDPLHEHPRQLRLRARGQAAGVDCAGSGNRDRVLAAPCRDVGTFREARARALRRSRLAGAANRHRGRGRATPRDRAGPGDGPARGARPAGDRRPVDPQRRRRTARWHHGGRERSRSRGDDDRRRLGGAPARGCAAAGRTSARHGHGPVRQVRARAASDRWLDGGQRRGARRRRPTDAAPRSERRR